MNPPPSTQTAEQAWAGKNIRLVLLGKKSINSVLFTETYTLEIEEITGTVSLADAIAKALDAVQNQTSIPADLVKGVEFRFVPRE